MDLARPRMYLRYVSANKLRIEPDEVLRKGVASMPKQGNCRSAARLRRACSFRCVGTKMNGLSDRRDGRLSD